MVKTYLLLGLRNFQKDKVASSINIIGLSVAVGFAIAVFLLLRSLNTSDAFHEHGDRVFLVGHSVERFGEVERWGTSPLPLGPALAVDFPQVEHAVRFENQRATVRGRGSAFSETVSFADPGFFDLLTFPLQRGQPTALEDPGAVILSADMAAKYFRDEDPLGQQLVISFPNGLETPFTVQGVAQPFPHGATLRFGFLLGYDVRVQAGLESLDDWSAFTDATFIELAEANDASAVADQLQRYVPPQNAANSTWQARSYFLDNISHPGWSAEGITFRAMRAPSLWATVMFGGIAALMLAVACFNYVIISLGAASRRLKEIGVRKTLGAERRQLVAQFLAENLVLCFVALLMGTLLALGFILPKFGQLTGETIPLSSVGSLDFWLFLGGLLAVVGLASGAYPALYVSSFQPIQILQGKRTLGERKGLIRVLATTQFVLAIATISICVFAFSSNRLMRDLAWGYDPGQTLVIEDINHEQYTILRNEALQIPEVLQVAGAQNHVGRARNEVSIQVGGREQEAAFYSVGPAYLTTVGLGVRSGRPFEEGFASDGGSAVVINEALAEEQGWTDAVGQSLRYENEVYSVVGVVKDFLIDPYWGTSFPAFFAVAGEDDYRYVVLRVEAGAQERVAASLQAIWGRHFPEAEFECYPQTAVLKEYHEGLGQFARNVGYLAIFAVLVSCMGLFGIASQRAALRIKEVGIRKALGASPAQIIFLVNRGFLSMLAVAALIATPLCYVGFSTLLRFVPSDLALGASPFILSNLAVLLLAASTLAQQTTRLVKVNPADVLRQE